MLQANILGAMFVFLFLRFVLPVNRIYSTEFHFQNQYLFLAYLIFAVIVGGIVATIMIFPVLKSHRKGPQELKWARQRAMRIPFYQSILVAMVWLVGTLIFVLVNFHISSRLATTVGVASALGGATTSLISYLQAERLLRPITTLALSSGVPEDRRVPGVQRKILLTWSLTTGIPIVGIGLILLGHYFHYFDGPQVYEVRAVAVLAVAALVSGFLGVRLVSGSIAHPLESLKTGLQRLQRGDMDSRVTISDGSELGVLQAGFNDMVDGLQQQQAMQDLFGRYVGEEVVLNALEHGTQLGGEERDVAVLFVDVAGSTRLAVEKPPAEVVAMLNDFFRIVVESVDNHGGYINKFQGDAALAIFGAPVEVDNPAGRALRSAREIKAKLDELPTVDVGIGVAFGTVIAGHIGHARRFEYTVIGDPVNQAARLTSLAKDESGRILATARVAEQADAPEAKRWTFGRSVELRGRGTLTRLSRPLRPTLADHTRHRTLVEKSRPSLDQGE